MLEFCIQVQVDGVWRLYDDRRWSDRARASAEAQRLAHAHPEREFAIAGVLQNRRRPPASGLFGA